VTRDEKTKTRFVFCLLDTRENARDV